MFLKAVLPSLDAELNFSNSSRLLSRDRWSSETIRKWQAVKKPAATSFYTTPFSHLRVTPTSLRPLLQRRKGFDDAAILTKAWNPLPCTWVPASFSRVLDLPAAPLTGLVALWLLEKRSILLCQYNSISSRNEGGYQIPNTEAPWLVIWANIRWKGHF